MRRLRVFCSWGEKKPLTISRLPWEGPKKGKTSTALAPAGKV